MVRLHTLGHVDLQGADGTELRSVLAQPKRLALLTCLALNRAHAFLRRDQALAMFWPEFDDARARAALNRAIHFLRSSLGDGIVVSRGDAEIGLSDERFWCDAAAFRAAAEAGRLREAVELYRGDLLEGFHVSGAPEFERWLDAERDGLRELAYRSAWALAEHLDAAGDPAAARGHARWAADRLPWDESAVQRLMTFLDRTGDRAGAVHTYDRFVRRMAIELDLAPSPETRALVDAIRSREATAELRAVVRSNPPQRTEQEQTRSGSQPQAGDIPEPRLVHRGRSGRNPKVKPVAVATIGAVVLVVAFFAMLASQRRDTPDPQTIVVIPFVNLTGDSMLDPWTGLATRRTLERLADLVEAAPSPAAARGWHVEPAPAGLGDRRSLARHAPSVITVASNVYRDAVELRLNARVDAPWRGTAWSIRPLSVPAGYAEVALRELAERVGGAVAVLLDPCLAAWVPHGTAPPTFGAYAEFERGDYRRAAELDTAFTWATLFAGIADMRRADGGPFRRRVSDGRRAAADSIAAVLRAMAGRIAPLQRHWLDGALAQRSENWSARYDAMRQANAIAPGAFALAQASSARWMYRPRESVQLLEQLSTDTSCHDVEAIRFMLADSYHQLRDHARELETARLARNHADGLDALWHEVRARAALGQRSHVRALLDTALSLPRADRYTPGGAMMTAAEEFRAHGYPQAASEALARGLDWYRSRPADELSVEASLWGLAEATYRAGRWVEADSLFRRVAAESPVLWADVQGFLGSIAVRRGDRPGAERILASLERLRRSAERPVAEVFYAEARIRALLGDPDGAVVRLRDWIGGQGHDLHGDIDFEGIADFPPFREFVRPKG